MVLEPVKATRLRRQSATNAPASSPSATDSGTPSATSGQVSGSDTSTAVSSTATSEAPPSTVASSSDSNSPTVVSTMLGSSPSSNTPTSSRSASDVGSSSASSSSQSASSSRASTPSSSTIPSSTSTSLISPISSSTASSSTDSSTTSSQTATSTPASPSSSDPSTSTTPSKTPASSDPTVSLTTITSSIVTTIDGHATTVPTTFPTSLNSPPSTGPSSGKRTGIIAGSAIVAGLLALLIASGLFVFYRRRNLRKISLAHRALPTPRSALLADEDAFDLAEGTLSRPMGETGGSGGAPQLLRPRGLETGSIFHEGVWPPPGERSRLEDPLLVGSTVDLTSIVDEIMGASDHHDRSISAGSDIPLLANMSPERTDDMHKGQSSTSAPRSRLAVSASDANPSETTPLNPSGHERQLSDDSSPDVHRPPPPVGSSTGTADIERVKSGRSTLSVSTTGSPPSEFTHMRGAGRVGAAGAGFGLGSLVVVNATPEAGEREELERERDQRGQREQREREGPLVDLTPILEDSTPPREIPPLYHMIPQNASDTWTMPPQREEANSTAAPSHPTQSPQSPRFPPPPSTSAHYGQAL